MLALGLLSSIRGRLRDEFGFIRGNVLVLMVSYMVSGLASGLYSSFRPLYIRELGASEFVLGLLFSLGALVAAFMGIPGAHIADKHGRKRVIVVFTFGAALGYLVHSLAPDWRYIIFGVLVLDVSRIYIPALEAIEADSLPEERRGMGYSIIAMAPSLTMVVGPPIAGYLVASMGCVPGMRAIYFLVFLLVSGIGLLRALWLKETVVPESELGGAELGRSLTEGFRSMREALKDVSRDLWVVIVVSLIFSSELPLFNVYLPLFAYDVAGVTLVEWGVITSMYWLATLLLSLPCGKLVDKMSRRRALLLGYLLNTPLILVLVQARGFAQFLLVNMSFALGQSILFPAFKAAQVDLIPEEKRGRIMGLIGTLRQLVIVPSAALFGWIYQASPSNAFYTAFLLEIGIMIVIWLNLKDD